MKKSVHSTGMDNLCTCFYFFLCDLLRGCTFLVTDSIVFWTDSEKENILVNITFIFDVLRYLTKRRYVKLKMLFLKYASRY